MAKLGRKRKLDPSRRWELAIPTSIAVQVELILTDPLTGRAKLGARSDLVAALLRTWLDTQRKKEIR